MSEYKNRKKLILKRIGNILDSDIDTPEKVVYLLVEIKKLRELVDNKLAPLSLYRDWVVHAKLDRGGTTSKLIGKFDPYVENDKGVREMSTDFVNYTPEFFTLENIKCAMQEFLVTNDLPTKLTEDKKSWNSFRTQLLDTLFECTINPPDGRIEELSIDKPNKKYRFSFKLRGRRGKPVVKLDLN